MKTPTTLPTTKNPLFRRARAKIIRSIVVLAFATAPLLSASAAGPQRGAAYQEGELLVKWKGGPKGEDARRAGQRMNHTKKRDFDFIDWQHIQLPKGITVAEAVGRYKNLPEVLAAEPNYQHASIQPAGLSANARAGSFTTDDSLLPEQYALQRLGANRAWGVTNGSSNIVVAVIDTGINYRHEDLAANMWRNPGEIPGNGIDDDGNGYRDDVHGIDVVNDAYGNDSDPNDEGSFYHGTACAGVIGAVGNNSKGIAGMNWSVQLMAIRSGGTNGFLTGADVIDGLNYVVLMKKRGVNLRVVNMSFGGTNYSQAMRDAHERVAAEGVLQVAAAGNQRADNDSIPAYPASYNTSNLLSVAASDSLDSLATFSCYGRTNVDLAAPGVAIIMTGGPESNAYTVGSGTSFSTPYTVGAAALLLAAHPELTAADLKRVLMDSVDILPELNNKMVTHGRLNIARALSHSNLVSGVPPFVVSEPRYTILSNTETPRSLNVTLGSSGSMSVSAAGSEPLYYQWRRSFVPEGFTDLPGATNAILSFASVTAADAGIYCVVVSNAFGSTTNDKVMLGVQSTIGFSRIVGDPLVTDAGDALSGSWGDYDNDGDPDVFLSKPSGQTNALFRNNGNGSFTKVATGSIGIDRGDATGAAWADFDNDDDLDLFVPNGTNQHNLVYRNDGNGVFTRITTSALAVGGLSFNGAWADYDRDGWLDLFVSNGGILKPQNNFLFRNNGDGTFGRVTVGNIVNDGGDSLGSSWSDFDQDGFPDLFVANFHSEQNFLYHNNAGQGFSRITSSSAELATGRLFTCGSWSDYDNDLDLDLLVSAGGRSILYQNGGQGDLHAVTAGDLGQDHGNSFGAAWGDFDNDGFVDAYFANSSMAARFLYRNNGDGTFTRIIDDVFVSNADGAGCEAVDYNNDGFLDLFVTGFAGGTNTLLRNQGNTNNWLTLTLRGTESNRDAIGAKIKLRATIGGANRWQMREISGNGGWGSRNAGRAAFGLGDATNIDLVRIEWPSGTIQELENVRASQFLTVTEPGLRFVREPLDVFLRPGANTNLTALAWSGGSATYQWMFNGTALPGQNNPMLSITAAQWAHQGEYAVVVNDGPQSVTSRVARLTLIIDPIIVQQPLNQPVLPGATVTLSVAVTNTATLPIAVRWRRNGISLSDYEFIYERTAYLTITNVQPPANYSVVLTNLGRGLASSTATLSLLTDTNSNGLPDDWELAYGVTDPVGDADADGMDNLREYHAGTSPTNRASVLRIDFISLAESQQQGLLRFAATSNHTYTVESSSSPGTGEWLRFVDVFAVPTNRTVEVIGPLSESPIGYQFYRVVTPRRPAGN
jgi:enediyne biosynthesis protein E4